jgi:hypothetical protein
MLPASHAWSGAGAQRCINRESNGWGIPGGFHQPAPLRAMGPYARAVTQIHGHMRELMTHYLVKQFVSVRLQ